MLGGKAVERKQCVAIFRQALDHLVVLRCVFLGEDVLIPTRHPVDPPV
jgi:hypothetical protein